MHSQGAFGGPLGGPVSGPSPQRYLDTDTAREQDYEQGEELSYYAIDSISSISDLVQSQNLLQFQGNYITSLRIMHCENFSNINGIQIQMFQNLQDINLSSNNIDDISELSVLRRVRDLNLSCNKINKIQGLQNMMLTLEKLVLSHNRIASL